MNSINVAIADDEILFRKGICLLLENFKGIELLFEVGNGKDLLHQLSSQKIMPDVLLLDLKMPELNGVDTAKILQVQFPALKIIVLSTYFSKPFIVNMLEIGAASYLPKNTAPEILELAIQNVVSKGFYYNDEVMKIVHDEVVHKKRHSKLSFDVQLSNREIEVLTLICEQNTNAEISKKLYINSRTVEGHRNNLLQKLNCRNTAGLVVFAIQHKLVTVNPSQFWD